MGVLCTPSGQGWCSGPSGAVVRVQWLVQCGAKLQNSQNKTEDERVILSSSLCIMK